MNRAVQQAVPAVAAPSSLRMISTLGGVALISGVLIFMVHYLTLEKIEQNKQNALKKAVSEVLPDIESRVAFGYDEQTGFTKLEDEKGYKGQKVYAGYDAQGRLVGLAIRAASQGYGDMVVLLYGYDPERECLTGMTVLESKETPGLGDRIAGAGFRNQFDGLDVTLRQDESGLAHPIEAVKAGDNRQAWQFDAITGATISSKAVATALNTSAEKMLPAIVTQLERFQLKAED